MSGPKCSNKSPNRLASLSLLIVVIGVPLPVSRVPAGALQAGPATREAHWHEDLTFFGEQFSDKQKDFGRLFPKDQFDRKLATLRESVSHTSDAEIILGLMRLVADGHVSHDSVRLGSMAFHRLPLSLAWFSDGLAVGAAAEEYKQALGARIIRIGSMTPEQLELAAAPYIAFENEIWLHNQSAIYLMIEEVLQHFKLTDPDGNVEITFAKADGKPFSLVVAPREWSAKGASVMATDELHAPVALYRKQPGSFYWYEYLPDSQTLYIQYNRCQNDPKLSFKDFSKGLFEFADTHTIQRTIVDLRFNSGGDSRVIGPLESGLKSRKPLIAQGHLYTLIGRNTFSSGLIAALDFRDNFHAILIGEPTGGKPNSYGEVKTIKLPNSGIEIMCTTKFFQLMTNGDPSALMPDISVGARSLEDYLAGRDPVLDAALHRPFSKIGPET
jgi:hypothetical protein